MLRGILIAIEGIDGAGKTTQVAMLAKRLREHDREVVTSKEPTSGLWGQKIRRSAVTGRMSLAEELTAFIEDRKEHVRDTIEPVLRRGAIVLLDRYFYSTIAYQGTRSGNMTVIADKVRETAPEPDLVVILDVPAETGIARIHERDTVTNKFEDIDNLRAVRLAFQALARGAQPNLVLIDGTSDKERVHEAIWQRVQGIVHGLEPHSGT